MKEVMEEVMVLLWIDHEPSTRSLVDEKCDYYEFKTRR